MARLLAATLDFTPQPSLEIELLPWRHYLQLLWRYLQFSWNARSSFGEWKGCMGSEWGRVVWSWSQYLISIGLCSVQRWTSIMSEWSKYFQAAFIVNIVSHSWKTGVKISQNIFSSIDFYHLILCQRNWTQTFISGNLCSFSCLSIHLQMLLGTFSASEIYLALTLSLVQVVILSGS